MQDADGGGGYACGGRVGRGIYAFFSQFAVNLKLLKRIKSLQNILGLCI